MIMIVTLTSLNRHIGSREPSTGGMGKGSLVEITKLYFYEEVVDLLPIKMVPHIVSLLALE